MKKITILFFILFVSTNLLFSQFKKMGSEDFLIVEYDVMSKRNEVRCTFTTVSLLDDVFIIININSINEPEFIDFLGGGKYEINNCKYENGYYKITIEDAEAIKNIFLDITEYHMQIKTDEYHVFSFKDYKKNIIKTKVYKKVIKKK